MSLVERVGWSVVEAVKLAPKARDDRRFAADSGRATLRIDIRGLGVPRGPAGRSCPAAPPLRVATNIDSGIRLLPFVFGTQDGSTGGPICIGEVTP
jgi:hypothetical protein